MNLRSRSCFLIAFATLVAVFQQQATIHAARPTAPELLPESTLAFARIADTRALVEKFRETSIGRMGQDEKIKPLFDQLYGSAQDAFSQVEGEVGLSLDALLRLPQGEMCIALVAPKQGEMGGVAIVDVGDQIEAMRKLLERGEELAVNSGATRSEERIGETTLVIFEGSDQRACYFEREGAIVVGFNNLDVVRDVVARWDGEADEETRTLSENRKFATVMKRCQGTRGERPQFSWYADPIEIARTAARGNIGAQAGLAILPALGIDGIRAVGGSMILAGEEFDGIIHLHVMLDNPRAGVLEAITLKSGDTTPEPWVPADVNSYMTVNWDFEKTFDTVAKIYDSFNEEGALSSLLKDNVSERMGIDMEEDVINQMDDRVTMITWMEPPARLNSQCTMFAVRVKDPKAFQATLDQMVETVGGENVEKKSMGGISYYLGPNRQDRRRRRREERGLEPIEDEPANTSIRVPQPAAGVVGDYLLMTDSQKFLEHIIRSKQNGSDSLADEPEYKIIASKIRRHAGGRDPGAITYNKPEQGFRLMYDLATGEESRANLATGAENNEFFRVLHEALEDNPLPPFSDLAKYLAPGGGVFTNDETGIHYIGFTLKRD